MNAKVSAGNDIAATKQPKKLSTNSQSQPAKDVRVYGYNIFHSLYQAYFFHATSLSERSLSFGARVMYINIDFTAKSSPSSNANQFMSSPAGFVGKLTWK